jgi:hypothetical protein
MEPLIGRVSMSIVRDSHLCPDHCDEGGYSGVCIYRDKASGPKTSRRNMQCEACWGRDEASESMELIPWSTIEAGTNTCRVKALAEVAREAGLKF